jgi:hypothetical protein
LGEKIRKKMEDKIYIDTLSGKSLMIQIYANNSAIASATAFVVQYEEKYFLITNWHVLSGQNAETKQTLSPTAACPNEIRIMHHVRDQIGKWKIISESLYETDGKPRWLEHPLGNEIDVVALPLENIDSEIIIYPLDLKMSEVGIISQPGMPVFIIGYPYGLSAAGSWPIWKTGHIASDSDLDYDNKPVFLIDATTRQGMSGSPVVLRLKGGYKRRDGRFILAGGITTELLGIYSGRIHNQAEIGMVWKPRVIKEILEAGVK